MKYDCDLIQDIAPLYKDKILSNKSKEIVHDHLSECEKCKKYYDEYSDLPVTCLPVTTQTKNEAAFTKKIKEYRLWQTGVFSITLFFLLTMVLPWFGYTGVSEISGSTILRHPAAIIGIGLFSFSIWYNYPKITTRKIVGYIGWALILLTIIYDFLTFPMGSVTGINIGFINFSVPNFPDFSISKSFNYSLIGFYIGVTIFMLAGISFYLFVRKFKNIKNKSNCGK